MERMSNHHFDSSRDVEKVDTIGGSQSQAERVARHFLRHFHNTNDSLGDRLRLLYIREKKTEKNKVK